MCFEQFTGTIDGRLFYMIDRLISVDCVLVEEDSIFTGRSKWLN